MPNLVSHLRIGVLTYPIYVFLYNLIFAFLKKSVSLSGFDLALGYLAYILGSDLPDLDSANAPLRNLTKVFLYGFSIYVFYEFLLEKFRSMNTLSSLPDAILSLAALGTSLAIGAGLVNMFLSLPLFYHRGFVHSITFGAIYGFLVYLFLQPLVKNVIFVSVSAFFGVFVHLLSDYGKRPWKAFKLW